jgi:hypothetical protein
VGLTRKCKSSEYRKYLAHRQLIKSKEESMAVRAALLQTHYDLPLENQDLVYIRDLRRRVAKTRNELRNMQGN